LQNPTMPLRAVAAHFGYTQPWLSTIIHSGAFQAHLAELQGAADERTIADVPARLRGLATAAIDKLGEQLEFAEGTGPASRIDRMFVRETADMALKALGFGRGAALGLDSSQPQGLGTVIYADRVVVEQARARILDRGRTIDHEQVPQLTHDNAELQTGT